MPSLVRKRVSGVFRRNFSKGEPTSSPRRLSSTSQTDSGYATASLSETRSTTADEAVTPSKASSGTQDDVNARNGLELTRYPISPSSFQAPTKAAPKTSIRQFTAGALQKLSESFKSKRRTAHSSDPTSTEQHSAASSIYSSDEKNVYDLLPIRSRYSFRGGRYGYKTTQFTEHVLSAPSTKHKSSGMIASLRGRTYHTAKRYFTIDPMARVNKGQRRRSESDKPRQKPFGPNPPSIQAPQIVLNFPKEDVFSSHCQKLIDNASDRTSGKPISPAGDASATISESTSSKLENTQAKSKREKEILSQSLVHRKLVLAAGYPDPFEATPSPVGTRGGDPVFFQGQLNKSLRGDNLTPLRRQIVRRSPSSDNAHKEEDSHHVTSSIKPQDKEALVVYDADDEESRTGRITNSDLELPQDNAKCHRRRVASSWSISTASDDDTTSPELDLHRCQAGSQENSDSKHDTVEDHGECLSKQFRNVHLPELHSCPVELPIASSAKLSSVPSDIDPFSGIDDFPSQATTAGHRGDLKSIFVGSSPRKCPSGIELAIEAIERTSGSDFTD